VLTVCPVFVPYFNGQPLAAMDTRDMRVALRFPDAIVVVSYELYFERTTARCQDLRWCSSALPCMLSSGHVHVCRQLRAAVMTAVITASASTGALIASSESDWPAISFVWLRVLLLLCSEAFSKQLKVWLRVLP
jgi:hypothetical protein